MKTCGININKNERKEAIVLETYSVLNVKRHANILDNSGEDNIHHYISSCSSVRKEGVDGKER